MINFNSDAYQVTYAGVSIQLLPKEFTLLQYLYEHADRSFTRDALLNAVWPLEIPIDRTVDDHIYRIRKKTSKWSHLFYIETIRGQGYKLIRYSPQEQNRPLIQDEQFANDVNRIFSKYHGLGMGAAMELLSNHQHILGLPHDPYYDSYLHFLQGDFEWLLKSDKIDCWEKIAYAVHIYTTIQFDHISSLHYFERLLEKNITLSKEWIYDLRLGVIHLYLQSGKLEMAQTELDAIRQEIMDMNSPSFLAFFLLIEMLVQLCQGHLNAAAFTLQQGESLLTEHPIQRERGAFQVAKAIYHYCKGDITLARRTLDEGIETIKQTHFIPHLIASLNTILVFFKNFLQDDEYNHKYQRQWNQIKEQYRFDILLPQIKHLLDSRL